jgi:hypothetical protein
MGQSPVRTVLFQNRFHGNLLIGTALKIVVALLKSDSTVFMSLFHTVLVADSSINSLCL